MKFSELNKPKEHQPKSEEAEQDSIPAPSHASSPTSEPYLKKGEYTKEETPMPLTNKGVALHGKSYAEGNGWIVCIGCFNAIEKRSQGIRYLSYREADIAARKRCLGNEHVVAALMGQFEFLLSEDLAGLKDSVYELRLIYNRGVEYKRTKYNSQSREQKDNDRDSRNGN